MRETTEWVRCVVCGHRRKVDYNRVKHSPELFEVEGRPGERFRGHYCATHHVSGFPPPPDAGREAVDDELARLGNAVALQELRVVAIRIECTISDALEVPHVEPYVMMSRATLTDMRSDLRAALARE